MDSKWKQLGRTADDRICWWILFGNLLSSLWSIINYPSLSLLLRKVKNVLACWSDFLFSAFPLPLHGSAFFQSIFWCVPLIADTFVFSIQISDVVSVLLLHSYFVRTLLLLIFIVTLLVGISVVVWTSPWGVMFFLIHVVLITVECGQFTQSK